MSYRFLRITNYYPQYLANYYLRNPSAESGSYEEQHRQLVIDSFEIASSYTKNLNALGVEAFDIISNASHLQNTWKKENDLPLETSSKELIIHQLKFYKPQVIWIDDFSFLDAEWKARLLKQVPEIKLIMGHICAPYNAALAEKFKLVDLMLTCIPCLKRDLEKLGIKTHLLYHGFEASILNMVETSTPATKNELLFSGSLYTGSGFHKKRIEYIEAMLDAGIHMDLYCNLESFRKVLTKKSVNKTIQLLKRLKLESVINVIPVLKKHKSLGDVPIKYYSKKLIRSSKPPVFGLEMYKLLSSSNICFNIHGEVADKCAGNIRLFEATGMGTCLVTDWKENIKELFEPDVEIVTYRSVDECIEKVKWLSKNPAERDKIAKAGQKKTLSAHTIENRAMQLNKIITQELDLI
jgi:hypothetical protein